MPLMSGTRPPIQHQSSYMRLHSAVSKANSICSPLISIKVWNMCCRLFVNTFVIYKTFYNAVSVLYRSTSRYAVLLYFWVNSDGANICSFMTFQWRTATSYGLQTESTSASAWITSSGNGSTFTGKVNYLPQKIYCQLYLALLFSLLIWRVQQLWVFATMVLSRCVPTVYNCPCNFSSPMDCNGAK